MEVGDRVIYYTHEASDSTHSTVDELAFVLRIVNEHTIDVVVLPAGGPLRFLRVSDFDPAAPGDVVGLSYWRPHGSKAPDFSKAFANRAHPAWQAMRARQQAELAKFDADSGALLGDRLALLAQQKKEQDELAAKLATKEVAK